MASETLGLRVGAIFMIWAVSVAGCGTAFLLQRMEGDALDSATYRIFKALAAGVVCGVGLIHVLPDAVEALSEITEFPLAFTIAAYAVVFTVALEHYILGRAQKLARAHGEQHEVELSHVNVRTSECSPADSDERKTACESSNTETYVPGNTVNSNFALQYHNANNTVNTVNMALGIYGSPSHKAGHGCAGVDEALSHNYTGKAALTAQLLEVGIVMHSVIIGVGLGAIVDNYQGVQVLTLALCIHQYFEGLGLGATIADAKLPRARVWSMCGLFSITTSLGVAIGICATLRSNTDSKASLLLQGIFGAAGAGILIYMALVTLIASEFDDKRLKGRPMLKAGMFVALNAGVTIMAVLAIWA